MLKQVITVLTILITYSGISQDVSTYEYVLPREKHTKPTDEYGNEVYLEDYKPTDVIYIGARELDYILTRGEYGKGILLGTFVINDKITFNGELVNTTWTPKHDRYYLSIWKEEPEAETETGTTINVYTVGGALGHPGTKSYEIMRKDLVALRGQKY